MIKAMIVGLLWTAVVLMSVESPIAGSAPAEGLFGRRVILADEIEECGVSRLGDLMLYFDGWAPATIDGFTWQSAPRGLDSYQTQSWIVMVDGARIDAGQFGTTALNRIPVHVDDIDSVELIELPQIHHGEFTRGGLIHIHTHRGAPGYRIRAAGSTGNEAGDPGPWAYTEYATPNVDRIGPEYSLYGSYGVENASAGISWMRYRQYPTDAAVRARNFDIAAGAYPSMTLASVSGSFSGRLFGGWHRAYVSSSGFEDFFFFKPYGREIPVESGLVAGGITGEIPLGRGAAIEYRLGHTQCDIGHRANSYGLDFDWLTKAWRGGVEMLLQTASLRHRYGVGYERVEAVTAYALSQRDFDLFEFYADWEWPVLESWLHRASVMATQGEGDLSFDAVIAESWRVNDSNRLEASVSYVEKRPERDGRIWYWEERGYDFLGDAGVDVTSTGPLGTARRWTMDIAWAAAFGHRVSGSASGYYRDFSDLHLEEQRFQFNAGDQSFSGPVRLAPGQEGRVAGGEAIVEARPSSRFRFRTTYRYEQAASGDRDFRDVWDAIPRHLFAQSVSCSPASSLALWARLNWVSDSHWHDYDDADAQTGGAYRSTLDGFVTLDASLTKWFWQRRLKASVLVRDLTGTVPRYHPIGASFDTTVFVGLEFLVGSMPSARPSRDPG